MQQITRGRERDVQHMNISFLMRQYLIIILKYGRCVGVAYHAIRLIDSNIYYIYKKIVLKALHEHMFVI